MSNPIKDIQFATENLADFMAHSKSVEHGYASIFYEHLVEEIRDFDKSLDAEHEVGVKLVTYGNSYQFYLTNLGYHNPYLIFFYGELSDGSPIQLIQHVSQINFVLIKLKKINPEKPKRTIGFITE